MTHSVAMCLQDAAIDPLVARFDVRSHERKTGIGGHPDPPPRWEETAEVLRTDRLAAGSGIFFNGNIAHVEALQFPVRRPNQQ